MRGRAQPRGRRSPRPSSASGLPACARPCRQFPGTSSLHLSARKNKQFEAPVSLLNISFKLHTLAPCPNAPRKLPQSSSSPELRCGLPGINNPRRSQHLRRRLRPKRPRGRRLPWARRERLMQPAGLPHPGAALGRRAKEARSRQRGWPGSALRHTDATWQRGGWGGGCSTVVKFVRCRGPGGCELAV